MGAHPGTKFRRMAKRSTHMVRKQHIENVSDYANQIDRAIPKGVLLTTKAGDKVNFMTIVGPARHQLEQAHLRSLCQDAPLDRRPSRQKSRVHVNPRG